LSSVVILSDAKKSLTVSSEVRENDKSEMFRFAQHDRHGVVTLQLGFLETF